MLLIYRKIWWSWSIAHNDPFPQNFSTLMWRWKYCFELQNGIFYLLFNTDTISTDGGSRCDVFLTATAVKNSLKEFTMKYQWNSVASISLRAYLVRFALLLMIWCWCLDERLWSESRQKRSVCFVGWDRRTRSRWCPLQKNIFECHNWCLKLHQTKLKAFNENIKLLIYRM